MSNETLAKADRQHGLFVIGKAYQRQEHACMHVLSKHKPLMSFSIVVDKHNSYAHFCVDCMSRNSGIKANPGFS